MGKKELQPPGDWIMRLFHEFCDGMNEWPSSSSSLVRKTRSVCLLKWNVLVAIHDWAPCPCHFVMNNIVAQHLRTAHFTTEYIITKSYLYFQRIMLLRVPVFGPNFNGSCFTESLFSGPIWGCLLFLFSALFALVVRFLCCLHFFRRLSSCDFRWCCILIWLVALCIPLTK